MYAILIKNGLKLKNYIYVIAEKTGMKRLWTRSVDTMITIPLLGSGGIKKIVNLQ